MTPDEKNLISGLFGRLKTVDSGPVDREAEALIRESVAAQPDAPYKLVQTVLVQEHALNNALARIAELEKQLEAAKSGAGAAGGSFLGNMAEKLGPWGRRNDRPAPAAPGGQPMAYAPQPMQPQQGYAPAPMAAPAAGGGFLQGALMTAAGVAGGALLFQGISGLMHQNAGAFGPALGNSGFGNTGFGGGGGTELNETVVNNYYGSDSSSAGQGIDDQGSGSGYQPDTDYQSADASDYVDDGGSFDGGGSDDV